MSQIWMSEIQTIVEPKTELFRVRISDRANVQNPKDPTSDTKLDRFIYNFFTYTVDVRNLNVPFGKLNKI